MNTTNIPPQLHTDEAAIGIFEMLMNRHWANDSQGTVYRLTRKGDRLSMDTCIGGLQKLILNGVVSDTLGADVELVIIESHPDAGNAWKAIFHVKQKTLVLLDEGRLVV